MKLAALLSTALTLSSFDVAAFAAQVVNGTPGTPTTSIDGRQIPPPPGQLEDWPHGKAVSAATIVSDVGPCKGYFTRKQLIDARLGIFRG
jgi:hypothetical protein